MTDRLELADVFDQLNALESQLVAAVHYLRSLRDALEESQVASSEPASVVEERRRGICHRCKEPLGDEKPTRGLHSSCYRSVLRAIASGVSDEDDLVAQGLIAKQRPAGRKLEPSLLGMMLEASKLANVRSNELESFCAANGLPSPRTGRRAALIEIVRALSEGRVKPVPKAAKPAQPKRGRKKSSRNK